jgi:hypothetical protein
MLRKTSRVRGWIPLWRLSVSFEAGGKAGRELEEEKDALGTASFSCRCAVVDVEDFKAIGRQRNRSHATCWARADDGDTLRGRKRRREEVGSAFSSRVRWKVRGRTRRSLLVEE